MTIGNGTISNLDDALTEHFKIKEFFWHARLKRQTWASHEKLRAVQVYLAYNLALILERVRDEAGVPIRINSGCRDKVVYKYLYKHYLDAMKRGKLVAKPSRTSDHFYMGEVWPIGVGAVDITPVGFDIMQITDLYKWFIKAFAPDEYGQAILYPEQIFIHISNPYEILGDVGLQINKPIYRKLLVYSYRERCYIPYQKWSKS